MWYNKHMRECICKKLTAAVLAGIMITGLLGGCGKENELSMSALTREHDVMRTPEQKLAGEARPGANPNSSYGFSDIEGLEVPDQTTLGDTSLIDDMTFATEKGARVEIKDGVTYVEGILIVNKTFSLPSGYEPENTHAPVSGQDRVVEGVTEETWTAFENMRDAAEQEGLTLTISSGYRSYNYQITLYDEYVKESGKEAADVVSARPGYSEHQSGLCFDLNSIDDDFASSSEGKWVNDNCYKYGFCLRFPEQKEEYTGYKYESWHLRYVGRELAEKLYNNGSWLSLEEYFGLSSVYRD